MSAFIISYRILVIFFYIFTILFDINVIGFNGVPELKHMKIFMAGRFVFLTVWNMILLVIYNWIALTNDFLGSNEAVPVKPRMIRRVRDYIFSAMLFPLSMFVGFTFWGIYFVDRELIYPRRLDEFVPSWVNHAMHTVIIFLAFFEMFSSHKVYTSTKTAFKGIIPAISLYIMIISVAKYVSGIWIYPVLQTMNPLKLAPMIIGFALYGFSYYFIGKYLNRWYWRNELKLVKTKHYD